MILNGREIRPDVLLGSMEHLNKTLKAACKSTSQSPFEETVLLKMLEILQSRGGSLKRPRDQ
eukprot:1500231-Karenia_brevis.AAC.1